MTSKIPLYREYHKQDVYPGNSYRRNHRDVVQLVSNYGVTSMLDYGCGKATQWHDKQYWQSWGFKPDLYDPGVPEYDSLPDKKFDAVISTDVLEHIPEEEIDGVLYWMFLHARKVIFLGIANTPAKAILPNGENAHCSVYPHSWWEKRIRECATHPIPVILKTYPHQPQKSLISDYSITKHATNDTTTNNI